MVLKNAKVIVAVALPVVVGVGTGVTFISTKGKVNKALASQVAALNKAMGFNPTKKGAPGFTLAEPTEDGFFTSTRLLTFTPPSDDVKPALFNLQTWYGPLAVGADRQDGGLFVASYSEIRPRAGSSIDSLLSGIEVPTFFMRMECRYSGDCAATVDPLKAKVTVQGKELTYVSRLDVSGITFSLSAESGDITTRIRMPALETELLGERNETTTVLAKNLDMAITHSATREGVALGIETTLDDASISGVHASGLVSHIAQSGLEGRLSGINPVMLKNLLRASLLGGAAADEKQRNEWLRQVWAGKPTVELSEAFITVGAGKILLSGRLGLNPPSSVLDATPTLGATDMSGTVDEAAIKKIIADLVEREHDKASAEYEKLVTNTLKEFYSRSSTVAGKDIKAGEAVTVTFAHDPEKKSYSLNGKSMAEGPAMNALASLVPPFWGVDMVNIPGGTFVMGNNVGEADEKPIRQVKLKPFRLSKYEVTRGQYARFMEATGHTNAPCWFWNGQKWDQSVELSWDNPGFKQSDREPVVCIGWSDAQAYITWLNQTEKPKHLYRLPSEAEWEYAARAGATTEFPWGSENEVVSKRANCHETVCADGFVNTAPVGSFDANRFGLFDMIGNAVEFVQDCYVGSYHNAPLDGAANTNGECDRRVFRGGSWDDKTPGYLRLAYRNFNDPEVRSTYGFRLAQDL